MIPVVDIDKTAIPPFFKKALNACVQYVLQTPLAGVQKVILFGSLARSDIKCTSDIDLCIVFDDDIDLSSKDVAFFKLSLSACSEIDADVVCCHKRTLEHSDHLLFRDIRRDGVLLLER